MSQNKEIESAAGSVLKRQALWVTCHDARQDHVESRPDGSNIAGSDYGNAPWLLVGEGAAAGRPRSAQAGGTQAGGA